MSVKAIWGSAGKIIEKVCSCHLNPNKFYFSSVLTFFLISEAVTVNKHITWVISSEINSLNSLQHEIPFVTVNSLL